jgi:hypothetical protein
MFARTKRLFTLAVLPTLYLTAVTDANRAAAYGGCFTATQGESTQVTGHRMILSVSTTQTTLYDQISLIGPTPSMEGKGEPVQKPRRVRSMSANDRSTRVLPRVVVASPRVRTPHAGAKSTTVH